MEIDRKIITLKRTNAILIIVLALIIVAAVMIGVGLSLHWFDATTASFPMSLQEIQQQYDLVQQAHIPDEYPYYAGCYIDHSSYLVIAVTCNPGDFRARYGDLLDLKSIQVRRVKYTYHELAAAQDRLLQSFNQSDRLAKLGLIGFGIDEVNNAIQIVVFKLNDDLRTEISKFVPDKDMIIFEIGTEITTATESMASEKPDMVAGYMLAIDYVMSQVERTKDTRILALDTTNLDSMTAEEKSALLEAMSRYNLVGVDKSLNKINQEDGFWGFFLDGAIFVFDKADLDGSVLSLDCRYIGPYHMQGYIQLGFTIAFEQNQWKIINTGSHPID